MICRDQAVVLRAWDFRETSKIVLFYARDHGKMSGLFKGIRKDPRKFASHLNFLSLNEIVFYKKRVSQLHLVSQCDLKKNFDALSTDVANFAIACFCAEFIDAVTQTEDVHPELFDLLLNALYAITKGSASRMLIYNFTIKSLSLSGFQPHLESCVVCHAAIVKHAFFSNRLGGLLCDGCIQQDDQREHIHAGTIASILFFQNKPWLDSLRLQLLPAIEQQLSRILFSFLSFNLERTFKSLKVLKDIYEQKREK